MDLPAGSLVLFDDRVLHRGRGNDSDRAVSERHFYN